jgi:diacylglycerol kinase (ATP)|tara:strand:+ start:120 stop:527 length:408 start_codon:yes stop_codon:yes gene_type:complete
MQDLKKPVTPLRFDPLSKPKGWLRLTLACKNSFKALLWLTKNEAAFKQELVLLFVALLVLGYWQIPLFQSGILIISILFVLFAEIVNTAIEVTIDRVGQEIHPLSGLAKDLGSAGVTMSMIMAAVLWISVLFSHL